MRNSLADLNDIMFEQIERINDDSLTGDALEEQLRKSRVIVDAGRIIVQGAAVVLRAEIARQDLEVEIPQTIIKRKKIGYDNR